jgi:hypothetical protein
VSIAAVSILDTRARAPRARISAAGARRHLRLHYAVNLYRCELGPAGVPLTYLSDPGGGNFDTVRWGIAWMLTHVWVRAFRCRENIWLTVVYRSRRVGGRVLASFDTVR